MYGNYKRLYQSQTNWKMGMLVFSIQWPVIVAQILPGRPGLMMLLKKEDKNDLFLSYMSTRRGPTHQIKKKKKQQEKKQKKEQSRTCWYFHTEIHSIVILNVLLSKTNTEMAYFPLFYHKHTQTLLYSTSRKASEFLRDIGHIFWLSKNLRKIDVVDVGKLGMGSSSNKMLVLEILKYRGGLYFCKRHKLWKIASAPGNKPFFSLFFSAMTKCPTKSCIPSIARLTPQHIHTNCMGVLYIHCPLLTKPRFFLPFSPLENRAKKTHVT